MKKNPYDIILSRHVTEKTVMLGELKDRENNPSLARCQNPKYVFFVDLRANKPEIASAIESIYAEKDVKVVAVNTINGKTKPRRVRGRKGRTSRYKKAIVTMEKGDSLDDV